MYIWDKLLKGCFDDNHRKKRQNIGNVKGFKEDGKRTMSSGRRGRGHEGIRV